MLSLRKQPIKVPNLKLLIVKAFFSVFAPFAWACEKISVKMHNIKSEICYRAIKCIIINIV